MARDEAAGTCVCCVEPAVALLLVCERRSCGNGPLRGLAKVRATFSEWVICWLKRIENNRMENDVYFLLIQYFHYLCTENK